MNMSCICLFAFFIALGISHIFFEPAYTGYIVAYVFFVALFFHDIFQPQIPKKNFPVLKAMWLFIAPCVALVTISQAPNLRDVMRDMGAIFSFLFGYFIIPRAIKNDWTKILLPTLSFVGVFISIWTLITSLQAYLDGASAYIWRGEYVPFASAWLQYFLLADYMMFYGHLRPSSNTLLRIALCFFAILLSLSRTGVALLTLFGATWVLANSREWIFRTDRLVKIIAILPAIFFLIFFIIQLDVVQERFERGVGEEDESMGWRSMENTAAMDMLNEGSLFHWVFGYGLGSRIPLPPGILDFDGNPTTPFLHNSFYTLLIKFGVLGFIGLAIGLGRVFISAYAKRNTLLDYQWRGGAWWILFTLGYAYTLQGFTQWGHLLLFGVVCAMLLDAPTKRAGGYLVKRP